MCTIRRFSQHFKLLSSLTSRLAPHSYSTRCIASLAPACCLVEQGAGSSFEIVFKTLQQPYVALCWESTLHRRWSTEQYKERKTCYFQVYTWLICCVMKLGNSRYSAMPPPIATRPIRMQQGKHTPRHNRHLELPIFSHNSNTTECKTAGGWWLWGALRLPSMPCHMTRHLWGGASWLTKLRWWLMINDDAWMLNFILHWALTTDWLML